LRTRTNISLVLDTKLRLLKVGDILPTAAIDGKGTITVTGTSPRVYFDIPNMNVEFSAEVFVENDLEIAHLIARSNHEDRPNGFGGYYLYISFKEKKMYFKKEETHVLGYSPRLQEEAITFEKGIWYKMRIAVINEDDKVKILGYFGKAGETVGTGISVTDDGSLKGAPFTGVGKWCFIRTNKPNGVKYRNVSIRSI
jgi:hypothetical protein